MEALSEPKNSVMKGFTKSIPFVELFEGLLVIGSVLFFNALSFYFLLNTWRDVLNAEPAAAAKAAELADRAAKLQSVWIAIGLLTMLAGFIFYYIHRSSNDTS